MKDLYLSKNDIPTDCFYCKYMGHKGICYLSHDGDGEFMSCRQPRECMNGDRPKACPLKALEEYAEQVRKETAKEILQRLFDMAKEQGKHPMSTPVDWVGNVEYLAKKYGVEME